MQNESFGFGASQSQQQPVPASFSANHTGSASAFGVGIASNRDDIYDANRRRILFVCGFNQIEMIQAESGLSTPFLQCGKPIKTVAASMMVPTFEIDDPNKPSAVMYDFSAKHFHDNIINKTVRSGVDYGVRSLSMLVGLQYEEEVINGQLLIKNDLADAYFDVIYPTPSARGARFICKEGLDDCPTCSLAWLRSPECEDRYHQAVNNGADPQILQDLHRKLGEAVEATLKHCNKMWSGILYDVAQAKQDKPGKNTLSETDHHIRKMLHAVAPELQQTNAIIEGSRETGRVMAEANAQAMKEAFAQFLPMMQNQAGGVVNPVAIPEQNERIERLEAELADAKKQTAEVVAQNDKILGMLGELLEQRQQPASPAADALQTDEAPAATDNQSETTPAAKPVKVKK